MKTFLFLGVGLIFAILIGFVALRIVRNGFNRGISLGAMKFIGFILVLIVLAFFFLMMGLLKNSA